MVLCNTPKEKELEVRIHSKIAVALFALIVSLPVAVAQNAAPGPASEQPAPAMRQHMHHKWGERGPREARWSRGYRRGMRWRGRGQWEFMLARLVRNPSIRERLGITTDQALKIRTQASDFRKAQIRNRAELQVKHLELNDLLSADKPDRGAIDKKLQEISAVRLAGEKSAIDFRFAMRDALTPDQRQKLLQMREEFFRRRGPGRERPHDPTGDMPSPDAQHR